jgi:exosortase
MIERGMSGSETKVTFWQELSWHWKQWPAKPLWFSVLGLWMLLFHFLGNSTFGYTSNASLFAWMEYCYARSPDDEHGYLIPIAVLALFWWKRRELLEAAGEIWWPALLVVGLALGLHVLAYMVQQTRVSILAFFLGVYGLLGLVWGRRFMTASFFPMILFVFSVPLATVSETLTFPLRILVTKISVGAGSVLGIPLVRDGSQILGLDALGRAVPMYDVAPACSGIRSLTALGAITMVYAFMSFKTLWKRMAVLFAAIPLAVAGNVARVTTVIIVGEAFSKDAALRIEQHMGFVTFTVAIACLLLLGHLLREPSLAPEPIATPEVKTA